MFLAVVLQNLLIFANYNVFALPKAHQISFKEGFTIFALNIMVSLSFNYIQKYIVILNAVYLLAIGMMFYKNSLTKTVNAVCMTLVSFLLIDYFIVFIITIFEESISFKINDFIYLSIVMLPSLAMSLLLKRIIKDLENKVLLFTLFPVTVLLYAINIYSMRIEFKIKSI